MYENRLTAFIDILGFSALVEESENSSEVTQNILNAITLMIPSSLEEHCKITPSSKVTSDLESVSIDANHMNEMLAELFEVRISQFSDCMVLSAKANCVMSCNMILEMIAKFSIKIWEDNKLLIRGGMTVGKLYHKDKEVIFGPAMIEAYKLEATLAEHPRILVKNECIASFKASGANDLFESIVTKSDDGFYQITLASAFRYMINDSSLNLNEFETVNELIREYDCLEAELDEIGKRQQSARVKSKYNWAKDNVRELDVSINKKQRRSY
ncbi:hypothetical protein [Pseudoalteromonas sp. bablab_jr010]|uniref:hypothetical protein n=1 Tax=Pseudoalteromonas sp. bablab_jr010 TaxID=2755063 RepID=UPI0018F591DE|nr:hypothetical protein [Pseudoalteromonas sp. bablab_jr010]